MGRRKGDLNKKTSGNMPREMPQYKEIPTMPPRKPQNISESLIETLFKCPICNLIFTDPHSLEDCGDTFCKACLINHFSSSRSCPVCKTEHRVWPKNHLDKQMTEILEEFRTAGRVHRLIFKNVEIENEKTFLDEIQLSLENTSLNDTRNFDETTETTSSNKKVKHDFMASISPLPKSVKQKESFPKIRKLKHYRNIDPLARISYSGPNLLQPV